MYPYPSGDLHIGHWYIMTPDRRARPLPPDARRERVLPDRLRRVRAAGRERRDQEQHQPARLDDAEHREHAPPVPDDGRDVRLGGRGRHRRPRVLPLEPVVVPAFLEAGLAYRAMSPVDWCPNDGTLAREQVEGADRHCWRCGAPGREARPRAVVPADRRSTPTSCSTSRASTGPSRSGSSRPTGSAGPRAPRSSSRPRPTTTSRAATSCASSRPARTRCSGRRSWSSPPSTRSSRS